MVLVILVNLYNIVMRVTLLYSSIRSLLFGNTQVPWAPVLDSYMGRT